LQRCWRYWQPGDRPILDGFAISGGNANGSYPHNLGGGMHNYNSSPTLTNCTFWDNWAARDGGGIYNADSAATVTNCILWGDTPDEIYNSNSSALVSYSDVSGGYPGPRMEGKEDKMNPRR
jgi:hypothetical protein